jgi:GNAT superfamily N-acetyltransferase
MATDAAPLTIRLMTRDDVSAGQRLREQAGWNQSDADWHRLLAWEPDGCFVGELAGEIVASATTTVYGPDLAWIGMVLVDRDHRRRGYGRQLFEHAMRYLNDRGVRTIGLDATPLGKTMYDRLGFRDVSLLERWRGTVSELPPGAGSVRPFHPTDLPSLAAFDARAFGLDRARLLSRLAADHPDGCCVLDDGRGIEGYLFTRPGARARHIGPLVAASVEAAERLIATALQGRRGEDAVMDIVMENDGAVRIASGLGLASVRPFIRMTRGAPPPFDPRLLYTSAGPELG